MKALIAAAALLLAAPVVAHAQRPDTVFFEDLTFDEIRDAIKSGTKNVIVAVGGVEDNGAQIVTGRPSDIATYTADRIARSVGATLVAPVIPYAPGGLLSVQDEGGFATLLEAAAASAKGSGFTHVFFLGESAGSQAALKSVAEKLDGAWKSDGVRVTHVSDYFAKARAEQEIFASRKLGLTLTDSGRGARFIQTSEVLAVNAQRSRLEALDAEAIAPAPQHGLSLLKIKVDSAVAQIRSVLGQSRSGVDSSAASNGPRVFPTPDPRAASGPSLFLEDLTATEIRDAIARGRTTVIVPTGGTEKNGFHMVMGKHNFHVRAGAELMARKLGNALVAPVLQYVPEGRATEATPGVLSCAGVCFEQVVESITRSAAQLGFKEVLLIGDNGGNQAILRAVAERVNGEWGASGAKVFALTDFYDKGHEYQDAWFLGQFGWDADVVGSHAGIKDTSQMLYVKPESVRKNRIADSFNDKEASSISGDPTKATAEFGRVAIEFKANGAIAQYRVLKAEAQGGGSGRPAGRRNNR